MKLHDIIRPNVLKLKPYSSARDEFSGNDEVFLDANENPYGLWNRYPDPYQKQLKEKLAEDKGIAIKNIFIGNGSDEVIDLAFRIFCVPGVDQALTFSPTYGMYEVSAAINDVTLTKLELDADFQLDIDGLIPYLSDDTLKLMFICSPNNPTGNVMRRQDIAYILAHFRGVVMVDEAYIDFAEEPSLIGLIQTHNNLIVSQTFSKARGLAGARIGTAYAHEDIIAIYNKIKPPYNISALNQVAALESLYQDGVYQRQLTEILSERERLRSLLDQLPLVQKVYPSDANFLLVEVTDASRIYQDLVEQGIVVRDRTSLVANCLRITVGTPEENNQLIKALKALE